MTTGALILGVFAVAVASLALGNRNLGLIQVFSALRGQGGPDVLFVVRQLRLPRTCAAAAVGLALGASGSLFQALTRNPLGSPDVVGFSQGAAVGGVVLIVAVGASSLTLALGSVLGGLATSALVHALAWRNGAVRIQQLILVGIGCSFVLSAVSSFLISRADTGSLLRASVWLSGSLNGAGWDEVLVLVGGLVLLLPVAAASSWFLARLQLGGDLATVLGIRVSQVSVVITAIAVCLSALAVAVAGPIGFVSFVSGPVARRMARTSGPALAPAACLGALITCGADTASRALMPPVELPIGAVTAVIGAPYLLWLLMRRNSL